MTSTLRLFAAGCLLASLASGCGPARPTVDVRVGALSKDCPVPSLEVRLVVDGEVCVLDRDGDTFKGRCEVSASGEGVSVALEYRAKAPGGTIVYLARAEKTLDVPEEGDVQLSFAAGDLQYGDDDKDGVKTIDELCLGLDPSKDDAPKFPDLAVQSEANSVAGPDLYLIGERVRITGGQNLPSTAKDVSVTIGPTLDGKRVELPVDKISSTFIEVQLPAGLKVADEQKLIVEIYGVPFEKQIKVGRALLNGGAARYATIQVYRGQYAAPLKSGNVCLPDQVSNCFTAPIGDACRPRLMWVTQDGRYALGQCTSDKHSELFGFTIPTGESWGLTEKLTSKAGMIVLAFDETVAIVLDLGTAELSTRSFDADAKQIGPPKNKQVLNGAIGLQVSLDGKAIYVLSRNGDVDAMTRIPLVKNGADVGFDMANVVEVPLGDGCPLSANSLCIDAWSRSMLEVGDQIVLLARPFLDRVEQIDFRQKRVTKMSTKIVQARGVVSDGTHAWVLAFEDKLVKPQPGVCRLPLTNIDAGPKCAFAEGTVTLGQVGSDIALVPEQTHIAAAYLTKFYIVDLQANKVSSGTSGQDAPHSVMVQP